MRVSMVMRGVEIIAPTESPDAWQLALLIRAILTAEGNGDEAYLTAAQRGKWLNLPLDPATRGALRYFILGLDVEDGRSIFSENPLDALRVLRERAGEILAKSKPGEYIREQVLYAAGLKEGPHPADFAMLKGKLPDEVGMDSADARAELDQRLTFSFAYTALPERDLRDFVARLESSDSRKDQELAQAILEAVRAKRRAPDGPNAKYQRIRRNKAKLRGMLQEMRRARGQTPQSLPAMVTIIGERLLASSCDSPVKRPGSLSDSGLTYRPAHMSFDEGHPTPKARPTLVKTLADRGEKRRENAPKASKSPLK